MYAKQTKIALYVILLLSGCLRFYSLDWGTHPETGIFHRFHPDETTVVESSALVGVSMKQIVAPYGKAPMYLLWAAGEVVSVVSGSNPLLQEDNRSIRLAHVLGRAISAFLGTLTVLLVFLVGTRIRDSVTGLFAAVLLGFSAGHIQQCHYYTVDVSLAFWVTLAIYYILRMPSQNIGIYLWCGIACGLATGTRLVGVWLGIPFLLAHLWRANWKSLLSRQFSVYFAAAAGTALICEPFLILDPDHFFGDDKVLQLMGSIKVVKGEHIQIWTLADFDTLPYIHHVINLLPYSIGWTLVATSLLGVTAALAKRHKGSIVLLGWVICYFLTIGYLHSKPIRYTVPMVPPLIVLSAWVCILAKEWLRKRCKHHLVSWLPILLVGVPSVVFGLSFTRIYSQEDSRFSAERWARENIPSKASVLVERGGFPTSWMVSSEKQRFKVDDASYFLVAENCVPYWTQINYVETKLSDVDWILIIEENRMVQYMSVPGRYPVAFGLYERLVSGRLGFDQVQRFKVSPGIAGWQLSEATAEPTVTAFDHPAVTVFKRRAEDVRPLLTEWMEEVGVDEHLPDRYIKSGMASYREENWQAAAESFQRTTEVRPGFILGHLLLREAYLKQGRKEDATRQWELATLGKNGIPVEARMGMVKAGMKTEGVVYLERFLRIARNTGRGDPVRIAKAVAQVRFDLGVEHHQGGQYELAMGQYTSALDHNPDLHAAKFNMGILHYNLRDYEASIIAFEQVVQNSSEDWQAHLALAQAYEKVGKPEKAAVSYSRVLEMNPGNEIAESALDRLNFSTLDN